MEMRRISRHMPPGPEPTVVSGWTLTVPLGGIVLFLGFLSTTAFIAALAFIGLIAVVSAWLNHRMRRLASSRPGEDICTFARSFDLRVVDSWIVRAVYEEVQHHFGTDGRSFPVRAADRFTEELGIVNEDLDDLAEKVAQRTGRSLEHAERNPVREVKSIADLIHFLNHQARRTDLA
jgi:hypothetical protein